MTRLCISELIDYTTEEGLRSSMLTHKGLIGDLKWPSDHSGPAIADRAETMDA